MDYETYTPFEATSAAGVMSAASDRPGALLLFALMSSGTTSATREEHPTSRADRTSSGVPLLSERPDAAIAELRRLSGLSWDQLARLFGVSRRSLHFWASGKPMVPANEEHLQRLLAVVRKVDRGSASANRTALLEAGEEGCLPLDLLAAHRYDEAVSILGASDVRRPAPLRISEETLAARMPRPPEELVGALQDRPHHESSKVRPAKSTRVRSGS